MRLFKFLFGWLYFKKTKKQIGKRNEPSNVKPGDYVVIEWNRIKGGIGGLKCINNDTETQKMLLEVSWNNPQDVPGTEPKERIIVDYFSHYLKNFNLLNPLSKEEEEEEIDEYDIANLQSKLNKALEEQEYEKAQDLQTKIDKLLKK